MARIRSLKPETPSDKKLASLHRLVRYTFLMLLTQADDDGLLRAEPRQLLGALYPHDPDVTEASLEAELTLLVSRGFIRFRQTRDGMRVIEIVNWDRHQKIKNRSKPFLLNQLVEHGKESFDPPAPLRRVYGETTENGGSPDGEPGGAESGVLSLESGVLSQESNVVGSEPPDGLPLRGGWPAEASRLWAEHIGFLPPGRLGKALSPIVKRRGWATPLGTGPPVRAVLECYCKWRPYKRKDGTYLNRDLDPKDTQFCSPNDFVRTYAEWEDLLTPIEHGGQGC